MMVKLKSTILMLFLFATTVLAQENPKIEKKTFFVEQKGLEDAQVNLAKGEKYYRKGKGLYDEALKYFLKAYQYNNTSITLNYKIGICYLFSSDKTAALPYLLKSSSFAATDYYYALGKAYQYNNKFDLAIMAYENYLKSLNWFQKRDIIGRINQNIAECNYSKTLTKDSLPVFIVNLGPLINTFYDEYNAILPLTDTILYFTSKRPEKEPEKRVSRFKFKEQILTANNCLNSKCKWVKSIDELTTSKNLSVAGFDKKEKRIYMYEGKKQNGKLYTALFEKGEWGDPSSLIGKINQIAYTETSISLDNQGNAYFVTNRRGGAGGKDIWYAKYKKNQRWGKPVNLGPVINTKFDEEGVYISPDGKTLYYSSRGLPGMGGYDVYKSIKDKNGNWQKPINLGYPINSPADELFYQPTADSLVALYATMRNGGFGGLDIYKIQVDARKPFTVIGTVVDGETGKSLNALISVTDNKSQKNIATTKIDPNSEMFFLKFEDVGNYSIEINSDGYKPVTENLICPDQKNASVNKEYTLERIKNPFTLIGKVTDADKGNSIGASITIKSPNGSIIGRTMADEITGNYTFAFADKLDFIIEVMAENYFEMQEPVSAANATENIVSRNFAMKLSKIDYVLSGRITTLDSLKPVFGAISFYRPGVEEPELIIVSDSTTGRYAATFNEPGPYILEIEASGYFFAEDALQFAKNQTFAVKNFALKKMEVGVKFVIENILFTTGKAVLMPESYASLDKFADLLAKNSKLKVEVSGHTDNVGSASVNKRISRERALTVKNYLVNKGIEEERILFEGYGFEQPIAPNDTPEGREKNRRVEIKILNSQTNK